MQAMSTNIASQLRLAADIIETGHPYEAQAKGSKRWIRSELSPLFWVKEGNPIRLVAAAPPDSRPLHNPDGLTAEQVGAGYRLCVLKELDGRHAPVAQFWNGSLWTPAVAAEVTPKTNFRVTFRLPLSTPWPEAEKPDPLTAIRLAYEAGKQVQYRNANSSGAWSQWHDYDGGKDMSAPMPIDPHGGYREWRVKPEAPPFQLPVEGAKPEPESSELGEHGARTKERPNTAMKTLQELEALPDDELRVMLAKITGKMCDNCGCASCDCEIVGIGSSSPNYPDDLNACHEVAMSLDRDQRNAYINRIDEMVLNSMGDEEDSVRRDFEWCCASARLRTIALILTLQKP